MNLPPLAEERSTQVKMPGYLIANASPGAKVYTLMWQCQNCQYQNDEWDETCTRCTAPRGASSVLADTPGIDQQPQQHTGDNTAASSEAAFVVARSVPPSAETASEEPALLAPDIPGSNSPAAAPPLPPTAQGDGSAAVPAPDLKPVAPKRARLDAIVTALIIVSVIGLVIVAWLAVQRGFLDSVIGQARDPGQANGGAEDAGTLLPDDPLATLNDKGVPKLKQFREYAKVLRDTDAALEGHTVTGGGEAGSLSSESKQWLESLVPVADTLILQYDSFEAKSAANHEGELEQYKIMLREQFAARMQNLLEQVAQARSRDIGGNLQAYMIGDKLIAALNKHAQIDSSPLKDRWLAALHAREQLSLDLQNAEVYKQLEARLAALTELHQDYSTSFSEAPPYKIRNGYIDATAGKLLGLYNDLAVKIEDFTTEFEEYSAGLDPALDSDRRRELIKQFVELAQEDHEYAFTETYKLYAKDKELTHPAYLELGKRVDFVKAHWPDLEGRYRMVYTKYETSWDRRFRDSAGTNGNAPPTNWDDGGTTPTPPAEDTGGGEDDGNGGQSGGEGDGGQEQGGQEQGGQDDGGQSNGGGQNGGGPGEGQGQT